MIAGQISLSLLLAGLLTACSILPLQQTSIGTGPVDVQIPSDIRLLSIDNIAVSSPSLHQGNYTLHLTEGKHTLVVRYEENWNTADDAGHIIRWPQRLFRADFNSEKQYHFEHAPLSGRNNAEQLSLQNPLWLMIDNIPSEGSQVHVIQQLQYLSTDTAPDPLLRLKKEWQALSNDEQATFFQWLQQQSLSQPQ